LDETGVLVVERTPKGHRSYDVNKNKLHPSFYHNLPMPNRKNVACARVQATTKRRFRPSNSSARTVLCQSDWVFEIINDLGFGMNYHKKA
jgi:hypothetical protein